LIYSFVILAEAIMGDIQQWLSELGLPQLAEVLEREQIDREALLVLSESDLKDLGLPIGQRAKLVAALRSLRKAGSSSVEEGMDLQAEPQPDGARSGQQAERRHLTVMFCDLVGSTELSQQLDPEALRELMRAYQQSCGAVIDKYDGHVAQYLGDGLMTYFGWPRAHEDDAERAIRAGLEIVEAVKAVEAPSPLQVRVGIATGPVVVGETGAGDASVPKLAVGETPNVAARIQGLAEADQIIIGPDTRRLVGNTFDLDDSGKHALKGIVESMRTWRVKGGSKAEGRFEAARGEGELTPLVGREHELGLLMERWQLAQDGEGQVVLLSGEPGIGKSRVTQVLRESIFDGPHARLRYQCSPYYTNSAFYPVIAQLERAAGFVRGDSVET
jgi:class 3 adenylate cyclase